MHAQSACKRGALDCNPSGYHDCYPLDDHGKENITMIVILWMTMVRKIKEGLQSVYLRLHDCLETMQRKEKERLIKRFFFRVS